MLERKMYHAEMNYELSCPPSNGKHGSKDGKDGKEGKDDISAIPGEGFWLN